MTHSNERTAAYNLSLAAQDFNEHFKRATRKAGKNNFSAGLTAEIKARVKELNYWAEKITNPMEVDRRSGLILRNELSRIFMIALKAKVYAKPLSDLSAMMRPV